MSPAYTRPAAMPAGKLPALSTEELRRYARHLILPEMTIVGQRRLKAARVLLVGAGGLGSPLALYLAAAGVGEIGIVDFDVVDVSNLQRQVLHGERDIGRAKTASARDRIADVNPHVKVETFETRLTSANALDILRGYDLVIDGTDNFATRYLTNDACVLLGIPNVYGSVFRFEGQVSIFAARDGPCYRCLFPQPPDPGVVPSCAEGGVLGVLPGLVGTLQATEGIKLLTGIGESLVGRLLLIDAAGARFRTVSVRRDPECPACGTREITELIDYDAFCGAARDPASAPATNGIPQITPAELVAARARGDDIDAIDVREPWEWDVARIPESRLIPLEDFADAVPSLDRNRDIVIVCKSGSRSASVVHYLQSLGFPRVRNLAGGTQRWSDEVDPSVRKY